MGTAVREALCVCYGGVDSYDFHGLESIQCMVERRKGGESGVKWLQGYRGDAFWKALADGVWSRDLMTAALCRSHTLTPAREGFNDMMPSVEQMKQLVKDPVAYTYEHNDGLRCTMMLMSGLVKDFNVALRLDNPSKIVSTQLYLPMPDGRTTLATFFSPLVNNVERLFATGRSPYPIERTLLTTGLTASGVDSLFADGKKLETPHLKIVYQRAGRIDVPEKLMLTRREFLGTAAAAVALRALAADKPPVRVAIVTTIYKYLSHGQHIGDRFLIGYPIDGEWHMPNVKVVSLYVDQKPEGDLSAERAKEFGFSCLPDYCGSAVLWREDAGLRCGADCGRARRLSVER